MVKISVINSTDKSRSNLTDAEVQSVTEVLQKQITDDFEPIWGVDAELDFVPRGQLAPPDHWWLAILDDTDSAGALGYHDMNPSGLPLGKVFAHTDIVFKSLWTVTASHELLEMLADPAMNLNAITMSEFDKGTNMVGRLYAYEICDACENDRYGYLIDDVTVSDFVYPEWFEPFRAPKSIPFDHKKIISAPLEVLPGGFLSVYDMTSGTGWQQIYGSPVANVVAGKYLSGRAPIGSRRERRRTPRNQWITSHPAAGTDRIIIGPQTAGPNLGHHFGIDEAPRESMPQKSASKARNASKTGF